MVYSKFDWSYLIRHFNSVTIFFLSKYVKFNDMNIESIIYINLSILIEWKIAKSRKLIKLKIFQRRQSILCFFRLCFLCLFLFVQLLPMKNSVCWRWHHFLNLNWSLKYQILFQLSKDTSKIAKFNLIIITHGSDQLIKMKTQDSVKRNKFFTKV